MLINVVMAKFKNNGEIYMPGDVIHDLASIKRFRTKLGERVIKQFNSEDPVTTRTQLEFYTKKYNRPFLENVRKYTAELKAKEEKVKKPVASEVTKKKGKKV